MISGSSHSNSDDSSSEITFGYTIEVNSVKYKYEYRALRNKDEIKSLGLDILKRCKF
jgi:hypothetical protein